MTSFANLMTREVPPKEPELRQSQRNAFTAMEVFGLVHLFTIIVFVIALICDALSFYDDGGRYFLGNTMGVIVFCVVLFLNEMQYNNRQTGGEIWGSPLQMALIIASTLPLYSYRWYAIIPWAVSMMHLIFETIWLHMEDNSKTTLESAADILGEGLAACVLVAYIGSMVGGPVGIPLKVAVIYAMGGIFCWCKARLRKQLPSMLYLYGASAGFAFLTQIYGVLYYSGLDGTEMPQGIMSVVWIMTIICSILNVFEVGVQLTRWLNCTPRQQEDAVTAHMWPLTRKEMEEVRGGCYFEVLPRHCEQTSGDEGAP